MASQLVAHLKHCAVALARSSNSTQTNSNQAHSTQCASSQLHGTAEKIDKSVLAIGQPRRIRCKEHLRYVAGQPCAVCGRSPSHAHHVRYAQRRGLGIKVSDEFTVPLCATHHTQLHNTTKEREWWQERKIDPLMIAGTLWRESQKRSPDSAQAADIKTIRSLPQPSPTESSKP